MRSHLQQLRRVLPTVGGALVLLLPAFINGYPFLNSDDGTYLQSGFILEMPDDRPIAYGLFLRVASLNGISLWLPIFAQAMAVSWLVLRVTSRVVSTNSLADFFMVAVLALLTPLSLVVSQLLPDVCAPVALLSVFLLLLRRESMRARIMLWTVYILSVASHFSHVTIFGILLAGVLLSPRRVLPAGAKREALALLLVTVGLTGTMLKPLGTSGHAFTIAALLDQGILKPYLNEACLIKGYQLCRYKDSLNTDPNNFLWDEKSPIRKEGGWTATHDEYSRIILDIHTTPKWLVARLAASVRQTGEQLLVFGVGNGMQQFEEGSHVYYAVTKYVPQDTISYRRAIQQTTEVGLQERLILLDKPFYAVVVMSVLGLSTTLLSRWRGMPRSFRFLVFLSCVGLALNAWSCGTFSNVLGRYGCRVVWLLPFLTMLCWLNLCQMTRVRKTQKL